MPQHLIELAHIRLTRFHGGIKTTAGRRRLGRCYEITENRVSIQMTDEEARVVARALMIDMESPRKRDPGDY